MGFKNYRKMGSMNYRNMRSMNYRDGQIYNVCTPDILGSKILHKII